MSGCPIPGASATVDDPDFVTAQGSSFFVGDGPADISGLSYATDSQSKEELAGSYCYTSVAATPPEVHAHQAESAAPHGEFSGILWPHAWLCRPACSPVFFNQTAAAQNVEEEMREMFLWKTEAGLCQSSSDWNVTDRLHSHVNTVSI